MKRVFSLFALCSVLAATPGLAQRADRDKPTLIEFDRSINDELKQVAVYTGNVRLTRGSLVLTGERMEVRVDPQGYRAAVITAAPGALAAYRQRRDGDKAGIDEFVEGYAERIEYDERTETVRFVTRALWKRLENEVSRDEVVGSVIVYNARDRSTTIEGGRTGAGDGRGRVILAPERGERAGEPATKGAPAPAALRPAPALTTPPR